MLCNTLSHYPEGIDPMLFFQDNDLDKIDIINEYNNLISQGKYSEASNYIENQEGVYGYFADFFNAIENRIYNLQEYLLKKSPKKQPFIYTDEPGSNSVLSNYKHNELSNYAHEDLSTINIDEPSIDEGMFWI